MESKQPPIEGTVEGLLVEGTVEGLLDEGTVEGLLVEGTVEGLLVEGTVEGHVDEVPLLFFKTKKGRVMKSIFYGRWGEWFVYINPKSNIAYILLNDKAKAKHMSYSVYRNECKGVYDPYVVYVDKRCREISTEYYLGAESTINRCFHGVEVPCKGVYLEPYELPGFEPDWDMCSHCGMGDGSCGYAEWHKVGKYRSSGVLALDREYACRNKIVGGIGLVCVKHS